MKYYRNITVVIDKKHKLFDYADHVTQMANNLSNAVRFRQRQVLTAVSKPENEWSDNEREVMEELRYAIPLMTKHYEMPSVKKYSLPYDLLDSLLKITENPDYRAEGLPCQSAQQVIKKAVRDMKSFFSACREYAKNPSSFTGKPELPGYKKKGGHTAVPVTNQDCVIKTRNGKWYAELPLAKKFPVCIGMPVDNAVLKQAEIVSENGRYKLMLQFEINSEMPETSETSKRICAIDFGVDNLMAVTNNCGLPCLLYKGGTVKAANQFYNKKAADIVSRQTLRTGKKFVPDEAYYAVTNKRNDQVSDYLHKCAKHLVSWCVENRIDTIVAGKNTFWKQNIEIGHKNNQTFVQIPFFKLQQILQYLCQWNGIRYVEQEESYTSKASFPDNDPIPVYRKDDETEYKFSGRRRPHRYAGMYKKDGFRGLYQSKDGTIINSDLNGSANILRKAFPDAFNGMTMPKFNTVTVIRHPDLENRRQLQKKQQVKPSCISKSRAKRMKRKKDLLLAA